jgi:hypothetical protein
MLMVILKQLFGDAMLKFLGLTLLVIGFFTTVVIFGIVFMARLEIQGAFDRSVHLAAIQTQDQQSPDLAIDSVKAQSVFRSMLAKNLGLDGALTSTALYGKIKSIHVTDFRVINVVTPTTFTVVNPIVSQVITKTISRPSVLVMAIAYVDTGLLPLSVPLPVFANSSDFQPN